MNGSHETPAETQAARIPLIGEPAPVFEAVTTQGPIRFPDDYKGRWVILLIVVSARTALDIGNKVNLCSVVKAVVSTPHLSPGVLWKTG